MLKKVFVMLAAVAFVFGVATQTSIPQNLADACSCVCCDHNGDGWSN